jgi:Family of unknown function (DUF5367)
MMPRRQSLLWIGAGAAVWAVATAVLIFLAGPLFGSGPLLYAASTVVIGTAFVGLFFTLVRLVGTGQHDLLRAATLFSIPGMIGEAPILLAFDRVITSMSDSQAGLYAAFLFLGYAALLSAAVIAQQRHTASTG